MHTRIRAVLAAILVFATAAAVTAGDAPDASGLQVTLADGQTMALTDYRAKLASETNNFQDIDLEDPETTQTWLAPQADMEKEPNAALVGYYAGAMRTAMSKAFEEQVADMEPSEEIDGVWEMLADKDFGIADVTMFFVMMGEEAAVKLFETIIAQDAYGLLLP